jgi:hypothetical protein
MLLAPTSKIATATASLMRISLIAVPTSQRARRFVEDWIGGSEASSPWIELCLPNAPAELRPTATKTRNRQKGCAVGRQLQWVVRPQLVQTGYIGNTSNREHG